MCDGRDLDPNLLWLIQFADKKQLERTAFLGRTSTAVGAYFDEDDEVIWRVAKPAEARPATR